MSDFRCYTVNPRNPTGPKIEVVLPGKLIKRYHKYTYVAFQNFMPAKQVLDDPQRIFDGIREHNEGEWWCYTGRPAYYYVAKNVRAPLPENRVFAVYLSCFTSSEIGIHEWRAERAAEDDPLSPVNWRTRYRSLLWKPKSTS